MDSYELKEWAQQIEGPKEVTRILQQLPRKSPDQVNFQLSRFHLHDRLEAMAHLAPLNGPIAREMIDRRPWIGQLMCSRDSFCEAVGRAALQGGERLLEEITTDKPYPPGADIRSRVIIGSQVIRNFTRNIERPPKPLLEKLWTWTLEPRQPEPGNVTQGEMYRSQRLWKKFWAGFNKIITRQQLQTIFPLLNPREQKQAVQHPKTTPDMCLRWLKQENLSSKTRNSIAERFRYKKPPKLWGQLQEQPTPNILVQLLKEATGSHFRSRFQQLNRKAPDRAVQVLQQYSKKAQQYLKREDLGPILVTASSQDRKQVLRLLGRLEKPEPDPQTPPPEKISSTSIG